MHFILHLNVEIPIVPGVYPDVEARGVVFGHKDVDGFLEFIFEVNNFMVMVQLKQAVEYVADCVLVVHQDAESRRVFGQQKFFALFVRDDVVFCRMIGIVRHVFPFVLSYGHPLLLNTLF